MLAQHNQTFWPTKLRRVHMGTHLPWAVHAVFGSHYGILQVKTGVTQIDCQRLI
jgi:hypothetical protein